MQRCSLQTLNELKQFRKHRLTNEVVAFALPLQSNSELVSASHRDLLGALKHEGFRIMKTTRLISILALVAATTLVGCKNNQQSVDELTTENESLRKQLDDRNAALESADRERLAAIARADESDKAKAAAPGGAAGDKNFSGIEGVTASQIGNELHVSIEGDVLFDSGKASLKDSSKKSLDKVAAILKEKYPGKYIRVAGFTDTDPIKKSAFKNNYYLGFDRAYSVREYIISKGLEGKEISLSSFGPDVPLKTKAQSRRVEVIVVSN